jgi:hypothetical protein
MVYFDFKQALIDCCLSPFQGVQFDSVWVEGKNGLSNVVDISEDHHRARAVCALVQFQSGSYNALTLKKRLDERSVAFPYMEEALFARSNKMLISPAQCKNVWRSYLNHAFPKPGPFADRYHPMQTLFSGSLKQGGSAVIVHKFSKVVTCLLKRLEEAKARGSIALRISYKRTPEDVDKMEKMAKPLLALLKEINKAKKEREKIPLEENFSKKNLMKVDPTLGLKAYSLAGFIAGVSGPYAKNA